MENESLDEIQESRDVPQEVYDVQKEEKTRRKINLKKKRTPTTRKQSRKKGLPKSPFISPTREYGAYGDTSRKRKKKGLKKKKKKRRKKSRMVGRTEPVESIEIEYPTLPVSLDKLVVRDYFQNSPLSSEPIFPSLKKYRKNKKKIKKKQINDSYNALKKKSPSKKSTKPQRLFKKKKSSFNRSRTTTRHTNQPPPPYYYLQKEIIKEELNFLKQQEQLNKSLYKKQKKKEWRKRLVNSPFNKDLLAENEKIREENEIKKYINQKRKKKEKKKLLQLKNYLIVQSLLDLPDVKEIKRYHKRLQN